MTETSAEADLFHFLIRMCDVVSLPVCPRCPIVSTSCAGPSAPLLAPLEDQHGTLVAAHRRGAPPRAPIHGRSGPTASPKRGGLGEEEGLMARVGVTVDGVQYVNEVNPACS